MTENNERVKSHDDSHIFMHRTDILVSKLSYDNFYDTHSRQIHCSMANNVDLDQILQILHNL